MKRKEKKKKEERKFTIKFILALVLIALIFLLITYWASSKLKPPTKPFGIENTLIETSFRHA